jgi:hypothetical protein
MESLTAIVPADPKRFHPALCGACNAPRIIGSREGRNHVLALMSHTEGRSDTVFLTRVIATATVRIL